ncbi:MAG TPA: hypothetical protein VK814_13850 [Acidobacteriaceae bacterium]|jgi:hypothetical protein|nr:hypothetical protein [Acidobacteriaceae bacterium]
MGELLQSSDGAIRLADAVMRSAGGRMVWLRLAAPAVQNADAEQLGLATPAYQDVALGPATFHKANSVIKLLISASAVHEVLGSLGFDSADVLFETAVGLFIDDLLYKITNSYSSQAMGMPYCYWLTLEPPVR